MSAGAAQSGRTSLRRWLPGLALVVLVAVLFWAWRGAGGRDGGGPGGAEDAGAAATGQAAADPASPAGDDPTPASGAGGYPAPTEGGRAYPAPEALEPLALAGGLSDSDPPPLDPVAELSGAAGLGRAELLERLRAPLPARDPVRLARELGQLQGSPRPAGPAARRLGDRERFWLHDISQNQYLEVEARLVAISSHAYGWLQADQSADEEALRRGVAAFSEQVYPRLRQAFGSEASPGVDGDARVHILHHQPIDGVAGYYYSVDQQPRTVDPHSNAREMFYINLEAFTPGSRDYLALLAHEFQHMIQWNQDPSESVWLNEGLSELAPHLVGLGAQTGRLYLSRPDTPLLEWTSDAGGSAEHYAAAFAFCAYLWERFGEGYLSRLTARGDNGALAVEAAAQAADPSAPGFDGLFLDWTVANLLPEELSPALPRRYRQAAAVDLRVDPEALPALPVRTDVQPYGADYWDLTPLVRRGSLSLDFQGAPSIPLLAGDQGRTGLVWWSGRDENSASDLRLQLEPEAGDRLEGRFWYELEEDWDYAYLQASGDGGASWRSLRLAQSREADPNGNNLGLGLSGRSQGWEDWSLDLAPYAGRPLLLRWLVLTDDAVSESGLALDDLRLVPGQGEPRPLLPEDPAWRAEGWRLLPQTLPQRWGLQVAVRGHRSLALRRFAVDAAGEAAVDLAAIPDDATVTLIVSAMTPGTRGSASYRLAAGR